MKWSTPLPTASIGIRLTALQFTPSAELLKTMSLAEHFGSNPQSSQATYTLPAASISALGSGLVRSPPEFGWNRIFEISNSFDQVAPPSVERNAPIVPLRLSNGTITVPSGCTTGWPPSPWGFPAGATGVLQVLPPSEDVLMYSRSPWPKLSNSV